MKYTYLFFDLDNTLFDFNKAERQAFFSSFPGAEEKDYDLYTKINADEWRKYELMQQSRSEVFVNRFDRFFKKIGYLEDPITANERYMSNLKFGYFLTDGATEILDNLQEKYHLVVITNGTISTQRNRLEKSGIIKYFDYVIISDEIGYQKPSKEYFDKAIEIAKVKDKKEVLVIGDSPTADIKGAQSVGIDTCWYNCNGQNDNFGVKPTFEIHKLTDLKNWL